MRLVRAREAGDVGSRLESRSEREQTEGQSKSGQQMKGNVTMIYTAAKAAQVSLQARCGVRMKVSRVQVHLMACNERWHETWELLGRASPRGRGSCRVS